MKKEKLISKVYKKFPVFERISDPIIEDSPYDIYGLFGLFIDDVIILHKEGTLKIRNLHGDFNLEEEYTKNKLTTEVILIFKFIDELFEIDNDDDDVLDILNTCIFEALVGNDYSYNLARELLSKEVYNHYLEVSKRVL